MAAGAFVIFAIGAAVVVLVFAIYLTWYGRWVAGGWASKSGRQRRNALRRSAAVVGLLALGAGAVSASHNIWIALPFLVTGVICAVAFALTLRGQPSDDVAAKP